MERYTEILDYLPKESEDERISTLKNSLNNILSVENIVENIYIDFRKSYSNKLSSEILNQVRFKLGEIIKEVHRSGCEPKRSDFLKEIKDTINTVFMQTTKKLTTYYRLWPLVFFIKTMTADSDLAMILSTLAYQDIPK